MPRQPFDTSCDLWTGPFDVPPNTIYATVPCRFVQEQFQAMIPAPFSDRVAYITLDAVLPQGPTFLAGVPFEYFVTFNGSDRVSVPSGSPAAYYVLFVEVVDYRGYPIYYRAHLALL